MTADTQQPLAGRRAFITGANKGIGFEAARQLGALGATVLVGARDAARGQSAVERLKQDGCDAVLIAIDVTDSASIATAAVQIDAGGGLDILVNNAGGGLERIPPGELDPAFLREVLELNLLGAVQTSQALLPSLRRSAAGRIVNVSSSLGSIFHLADPQWIGHQSLFTAYSISKAALNAFTALLAAELATTPIKVNAVEPGYTATDLTGQQGFQQPADAARVIVRYAIIDGDGPTGGFFDIHGRLPW